MSTDETRIQNERGKGHGIQEAPSSPLVLFHPDPDAIILRRRNYSGTLQGAAVAILLALGLLFLLIATMRVYWIGRTDLHVVFVVMDEENGVPIPGATVQVHSKGGFYAEPDPQDVKLTADGIGTARHWCRRTTCCGHSNGILPFGGSYCVYLPYWSFQASAPGYAQGEKGSLDTTAHQRLVKRRKKDAVLTIPLTLRRLPAP
jgi:hypothetical protein